MGETYEELEKDFRNKVKDLQERCKHTDTEKLNQAFAPGHYTGNIVEVCKICNKVLVTIKPKWREELEKIND